MSRSVFGESRPYAGEAFMPKILNAVTLVLVIVGALNWLLVGAFEWDLVAAIGGIDFGELNAFTRTVYILVGISALVQLGNLLEILQRED